MTLTSIWRHPVKAVGREGLEAVAITTGHALPGDRVWAVTHEGTRDAGPGWARKANFLRGVSGPSLMAVTARTEVDGRVTLRHPDRPDLTADADADAGAIVAWLDPIWPDDLPRPTGVARCDTGFTDVPEPWISIHAAATHAAVETAAGGPLSIHRWRGNLWLDGPAAWTEFDLVDRPFRIGGVEFMGREPITRCKATMANPETGERDVDTLAALRTFDHQDFGLYAEAMTDGTIAPGDPLVA
ncbi:MOSC domain-containing protein [Jannaschia sp. LMIT008]|uniref:MOSC domain-containing protein n=1 Tax=Jannaschia maritima TaxID=3032585 RepID=UPI0028119A95|nr:MOSC N-terminal beta barrel domain-containing protein [Jannaschia sp. LMIT008]